MRILLAEDEVTINEAITAILTKHNYSVDSVFDGQEALDFILGDNYDCLILDIMMPVLDGISVLKKVRAAGNKVPIIMLTAKSEIDDKVVGLDNGADDYLTKPFDIKELLARIRSITRRTNDITDDNLKFGDILLNRSSFELLNNSNNKSIVLASKEFQIMELLMSNSKQIISTTIIMDKVWGYDTNTDISVIWVYISNLRKKLKELGTSVSIKSMRNAGYFLGDAND